MTPPPPYYVGAVRVQSAEELFFAQFVRRTMEITREVCHDRPRRAANPRFATRHGRIYLQNSR